MVDISEELAVCSAIKVKQSFQRLWGLVKIPVSSLKTGSLTLFFVKNGKDFNLIKEHHRETSLIGEAGSKPSFPSPRNLAISPGFQM